MESLTPAPHLPTVLLTSFQTWKSEQLSNSSDDLLSVLQRLPMQNFRAYFLRQLPVDFAIAPQMAIATITTLKPDIIVCCGMAESRTQLNVESQAIVDGDVLQTSVALDWLINGLDHTTISNDAGQFVCNRVYYDVLSHIGGCLPNSHCIFLHVPILTPENQVPILTNTQVILDRLSQLGRPSEIGSSPILQGMAKL